MSLGEATPLSAHSVEVAGEPKQPPRTWRNYAQIVLLSTSAMVYLWIPVIGLNLNGVDPLAISVLAYMLTGGFTVLALIMIVVFCFLSSRNDGFGNSHGGQVRQLLGCTIWLWGTWIMIYAMVHMWVTSRMPVSNETLFHMNQVWIKFQAKVTAPDAFMRLTTCLEDALPDRNATITDFVACLKKIRIDDDFIG